MEASELLGENILRDLRHSSVGNLWDAALVRGMDEPARANIAVRSDLWRVMALTIGLGASSYELTPQPGLRGAALAQIRVPRLTDSQQLRLFSSRPLPRDQSQPGRERRSSMVNTRVL